MPPTFANGKICYIDMPATDIARSANFYRQVFGWNIRKRDNGSTAFDDITGEVSGTWIVGRPPGAMPGLLFYIMVDSVAATIEAVVANGGEIVQPIGVDAPEITARFRDPGRKRDRPLSTTGLELGWSAEQVGRVENSPRAAASGRTRSREVVQGRYL